MSMRIDVSEVKTFRECGRKWAFTSRNKFHLTSRNPSPNLGFGTMFHDGLARMYLTDTSLPDSDYKEKIEHIIDYCCGEVAEDLQKMMRVMLEGYAKKVLPEDNKKYRTLVAEHHFKLEPRNLTEDPTIRSSFPRDLLVCGSIDLIILEEATGTIYGLEHKTCKNFRSPLYNVMDEQPMLYAIALRDFTRRYNENNGTNYTSGGVMVNEVRKLKTRFEHKRLAPVNPDEQATERFLVGLAMSAKQIKGNSATSQVPSPRPGYMKCQMCDFQEVCGKYVYSEVSKEKVLGDFGEDFMEREFDHLDEKVERDAE